ncbi:MAG: DNA/RNA non-specific endonuclease [Bacteroidales bacterium]|nr:DNA/RNA non-specific endonuclease [Bacteroidales bacterium]
MTLKTKNLTFLLFFFFSILSLNIFSQNIEDKIATVHNQINQYQKKQDSLIDVLEVLKLDLLHKKLLEKGLPAISDGEELIEHKAYCLVYSEKHEQAKWVAHIISTDVMNGRFGRTNDFRPDSLIPTGSSEEEDYFTKFLKPDSTFEYDGFGFDRGHLAPSADFRWSLDALSESYLYSNMSPQRPQFNRGKWADLEDMLRAYVFEKQSSIFVVTGPVLNDSLDVIKRSKNQVSIPKYFFKIAYDEKNKTGIAFLMPNEELTYPIEYYAKTIDEVEEFTGIDFFPALDDKTENIIESDKNIDWWLPARQKGDVAPLNPNDLQKNYFNTVQAKHFVDNGEKVKICGTVVSTYKSQKGNVFINLDKQYPNQVFSISIFSSSLINFTYEPEKYLKGKVICVKGKVSEYNGIPSMVIENEKQIEIMDEEEK